MGTHGPADLYIIQARIRFHRKLGRKIVLLIGVDVEFPQSTLKEVLVAATLQRSRTFNLHFRALFGKPKGTVKVRWETPSGVEKRCHPLRGPAGLFETRLERHWGYQTLYQIFLMPGADADRSYGTKTRGDKVLDCHRRYLRDSEAHHNHDGNGLVVIHRYRATGRPLDTRNTHTWRWIGWWSGFSL